MYNMYRLSLIISEIYNKYLPLAEKDGIILNLDFSDTTKEISDPDRVKQYLDDNLNSALKRSDKGEVTIGVSKDAITITDSATTLSRAACALLSNRFIDVSSRVGFGTTVKIFLKPREEAAPATEKRPLEVQGAAVAVALDNSTNQPTLQSEVKLATKQGRQKKNLGAKLKLTGEKKATSKKSPKKSTATKPKSLRTAKPKKTDRQLAAAARKADREVKRIAKKASKQAKKSTTKKTKKKLVVS